MRIRTGYSFRAAIGNLNTVANRLQEIGWQCAPISDRNSTFGFTRWTKIVRKAGLRPIYGVELACTPELGSKSPTLDHWTFFAIDALRPLHDLIYLATGNPGKEPSLLYRQALAAPGVIKIAGHRLQLQHLSEPRENFYLALTPSLPKGLYKRAKEMDLPFIASSDNYYAVESDRELYRVALGWRADTQTYPQHIMSDDEWRNSLEWLVGDDASVYLRALSNREGAMKQCQAVMKHATLLKPQSEFTLRELCEQGAIRTGTDLTNEVYRERLERELKLIEEKQFGDYFLILADLITFAKERMVVGPARGSSCGSLVCYLLNITAIDPIPYGLIFERFIDINRSDLPDIDVDFSDERRHLVFEYAERKYGKDRVARLGTVGVFRPRSALNQAGIALRIPKWEVDRVADTIIERSGGDARALQALEDTLNDTETGRNFIAKYPEAAIIAAMEGQPNISSQHAAGIVITQEPILDYVALDARTGAAMCDKKDSEELNLLKIDALGLTQLSIFERCMELLGKPPKSGWLETLPLDDPATFEVFNKGHFAGIFQFNGQVLQTVTGQIVVDKLNDIVQITAVARPGPAASGGTMMWTRRRNGEDIPINPALIELTAETSGVVLFQEQTMRIVRELGSLSWEDTSSIRKAMSGRLGDEYFSKFKQRFIDGARDNGIDEGSASSIWEGIATMGSWQMNKSHCVAYGIVSYYCAYLKAHYPLEFAAATLDAEKLPGRQIALLRELKEEGISYVPFDKDHSTDRWVPNGNTLVGPLTAVKGIGPAFVKQILDARRMGQQPRDALLRLIENAKTEIDSLTPISDAVKSLHPDLKAINIFTKPTDLCEIAEGEYAGKTVVVIGIAERIAPLDMNEAIRIQRRGGRRYPDGAKTAALNIFMRDDTGSLLCRVTPDNFERVAKPIIERGQPNKVLYAIKGRIFQTPSDFRMLMVDNTRWLGSVSVPTGRWEPRAFEAGGAEGAEAASSHTDPRIREEAKTRGNDAYNKISGA